MTVLFRDLRCYGYRAYKRRNPCPQLLTRAHISRRDSPLRSGTGDICLLCVRIST